MRPNNQQILRQISVVYSVWKIFQTLYTTISLLKLLNIIIFILSC